VVGGRRASDSGDIVIGWLTRIAVGLAVTAVVAFDSLSVAITHLNAGTAADSAALVASQEWFDSHSEQAAFEAAVNAVDPGQTVLSRGFSISATGQVHLELRTTATTLLLHDIGPLRHLATVTVVGTGQAAGP
jgi:hypothetical protein